VKRFPAVAKKWVVVASHSATKEMNLMRGSPTEISGLRFMPPARFVICFADGYCVPRDVAVFEMPVDRLRWETLKLVPGGKAITVNDTDGEPVELDAETVRYYVDPAYAKRLEAEHASQQFTRSELEQLVAASAPHPPGEPEGDFIRAAWR